MARLKKQVTITLDEETIERLKQIAKERHTNVSQLISDLAWATTINTDEKEEQK